MLHTPTIIRTRILTYTKRIPHIPIFIHYKYYVCKKKQTIGNIQHSSKISRNTTSSNSQKDIARGESLGSKIKLFTTSHPFEIFTHILQIYRV